MSVAIMVDGQVIEVADDDPRVPLPASPPATAPQRVSSLAAKLALEHAGLLASAASAIQAAGGDAVVWYTEAQHWDRQNTFVLQFAASLGLSSDQVDGLFAAASTIDASL